MAISTVRSLADRLSVASPTRLLQRHSVYVAVVLLLVAYPGIYHLLLSSPLGSLFEAVLPDVDTMVAVLYFGLFAMSFDFISGYTGYLSFGHAAFYGTGAYGVILIANGKIPMIPETTPFMLSLLVVGVLAVLLAVVIGLLSFRLTGVYFAMITLGFSQVLYVFVRDWDYAASNPRDGPAVLSAFEFSVGVPFVDELNLAIGILGGDEVALLGQTLSSTVISYYMVGLVVLVCFLAMRRILHSPFGRVMVAIRENEERARAVGYNVFRYKLGAFAMSAFFGAVAGGLFAGYRRSVTPESSFYFLVTGDALLASIIGGLGTLVGPLYGRLFDETVREFLSKEGEGGGLLPFLRDVLSESVLTTELFNGLTVQGLIETALNGHASLYVGLLFIAFVLFVPGGLLGYLRDRLGGQVSRELPARLWGER